MVHNTAKLGGPASDVVVAKVGVSCTIFPLERYLSHLLTSVAYL